MVSEEAVFVAVLWDKGSSATDFTGLSVWRDMERGLLCLKLWWD